jgi:long-chain acyl-CoA synthetase
MLNIEMTMAEAFRDASTSREDTEALVCGETRATYGQLVGRVGALARGLHDLGVRKGDKIVALLPPGPEFVYLFFAVAELGAVIAPLNPQLRPRSLSNVLRDAEPVALVTARPIEEKVLRQATGLHHLISTVGGEVSGTSLTDLMSLREPAWRPPSAVSPQDLLALLYTSGTTGSPKGTMHNHRSLIAPVVASLKVRELWKQPSLKALRQTVKALARYRERLLRAATQPQTWLSTTGWYTVTGLEIMFQALLMGDRLVVMPRFAPREALRLVERERVTILVAVPTAFQVMLGLRDFERYDTSSLLVCGIGAAPCPPHLAREIQRRFHCAIHIGFGGMAQDR